MKDTPKHIFAFINSFIFLILAIVFSQLNLKLTITLTIFCAGTFFYLMRGIYNLKKHRQFDGNYPIKK